MMTSQPPLVTGIRKVPGMLIMLAVLLFVFAVYAPAIRLMPFYDDAVIIPAIAGRNLASIFVNNGAVDVNYRPLSYALWLLVRDLFGWFTPTLLHAWNVWLHVLNMALLAALAARLGRLYGLGRVALPALCALIFGLFPFSYEAVLWAAAVNHTLMTACGLTAILLYLSARGEPRRHAGRLAASCAFLLAACLSHEMGFLFGVLLLVVELGYARRARRRPVAAAVLLSGLSMTYPVFYQLFLRTFWATGSARVITANTSAWLPNFTLQAQGVAVWLVVLLRDITGLPEPRVAIVLALFAVALSIALLALWRLRLLEFGVMALAWWLVAIAPSTLLLADSYVSSSPRLLYEPSAGIALLWGGCLAGVLRARRWPPARLAILAVAALLLAWCVPFIGSRRDHFARLTPPLRMIDADMRAVGSDARVLLINMPWWTAPANPSFLVGNEGMQIFQHGGAPTWTWLASVGGTRRETQAVRHDVSLSRSEVYQYGIFGEPVDDAGIRRAVLASNLIYRFDYDPPGLRAIRIAWIGADETTSPPLAKLAQGGTQAAIRGAQSARCGDAIALEVTWSDVRATSESLGVFIHVYDVQDRQAIVADRDLVGGTLPLERVPPAAVITETRQITLPSTVAAVKDIRLGAYLRTNGARLTATRAGGGPWEGDSVVVPIADANPELCHRIGR